MAQNWWYVNLEKGSTVQGNYKFHRNEMFWGQSDQ